MAMMRPVFSLRDFQGLVQERELDPFPFYGVLLYSPLNGLDGRLHEYVSSHWALLNALTGESCLVFAVENLDRDQPISAFKPEDIYGIARYLGATVSDLPCIVYFTEPKIRPETLVVKLRAFLPAPSILGDEDLTGFFRDVSGIVDACRDENGDRRLRCLRRGLERGWPQGSPWPVAAAKAGPALVASVSTAATVAKAISTIITVVSPLL